MHVLGIDPRSSGKSMSALDYQATSPVTRPLITCPLLSMWFQGLFYPWNSWSLRLPILGMSSSWFLNTECFQLLFSGSPLSSTIQTHSSNGMEKWVPGIASIRVTRHRDNDADSRCYLTSYWIKLDCGCRTLDVKSSPLLVIFLKWVTTGFCLNLLSSRLSSYEQFCYKHFKNWTFLPPSWFMLHLRNPRTILYSHSNCLYVLTDPQI